MSDHVGLHVGATTRTLWRVGALWVVGSTAVFHARVRGSFTGLGGLKEAKMFLLHPLVKLRIVGGLRDREVACSASDIQGLNFESWSVWRAVSSYSSHYLQEIILAQFSLYVNKSDRKPDSFHLFTCHWNNSNDISRSTPNPLGVCHRYCFHTAPVLHTDHAVEVFSLWLTV